MPGQSIAAAGGPPPDHFFRHLERSLDLGFVRDLVRGVYADIGRPSVDPVVFFKLQLVMFFAGLRSERQMMQVVADRIPGGTGAGGLLAFLVAGAENRTATHATPRNDILRATTERKYVSSLSALPHSR